MHLTTVLVTVLVALTACGSDPGDLLDDGGSSDASDAAIEPPPTCPDGNMGPGTAPNGTIPGALSFPHPTLRNATVVWMIAGDRNANGTVTVRYRAQGTAAWRRAMPLRRAIATTLGTQSWTDRHAGSLFDLEPATTYEIEAFLLDPDGGCELQTGTLTTRDVPAPMAGAPVRPATPGNLGTVLTNAVPGDIVELDGGTYAGFSVGEDGTAAQPIVIRAKAGVTAIVDGDLSLISRSHVHVTGLTINGRIRFNASTGIVITRNTVNAVGATGDGIDAALRSEDAYIADNVVLGPTTWAEGSLGVNGDNLGEGIRVTGPGHVVEHNRVSGFRDCLSTMEPGEDQFSLDFIENDLGICADDGIEVDYCVHNCRVVRNRFTNAFIMASSQPGLGGPTYFIRNAGYNVIHTAFKLHNGSVGDVLLHNTVVKNGDAFGVFTSDSFSHQYGRNNVFIGGPGETFNMYESGSGRVIYLPAAVDGDYDFDGLGSTTGDFTGRIGDATFASFAELTTETTEAHAVVVDLAVFAAAITYPAQPFPAKPAADLQLAPSSAALDAGEILPNINDDHTGNAPDLGAHEMGAPLPNYGPR